MDQQIAGIAALYIVLELIKFIIPSKTDDTNKKVSDLHEWIGKTDDDGRMLIYTPKVISIDMEKILDTLRDISKNQEKIALLLGQIAKHD